MFAKDRLMEQSDAYRMWFCKICGLQAIVVKEDPENKIPSRRECTVCQTNKVAMVKLPFATKLLMQELAGMNIICRVLTTECGEPRIDYGIRP